MFIYANKQFRSSFCGRSFTNEERKHIIWNECFTNKTKHEKKLCWVKLYLEKNLCVTFRPIKINLAIYFIELKLPSSLKGVRKKSWIFELPPVQKFGMFSVGLCLISWTLSPPLKTGRTLLKIGSEKDWRVEIPDYSWTSF